MTFCYNRAAIRNANPHFGANQSLSSHMEVSKLKDQGLIFKTKSANFVINPALKDGKLTSDAVNTDFALSSDPEQPMQTYGEGGRFFSWPGEYEVKGVAVHAHPIAPNSKKQISPLLFVIYTDTAKVCYIPELKEELHSDLIEKIGDVDLLIFPATGSDKIWHSTIEEIEPKAFLPLSGENAVSMDAFLSKIGLTKPAEENKITVKSKSELRSDQIAVFLLA